MFVSVTVGDGVLVGDGVEETTTSVARTFSANCVAVRSISGMTGVDSVGGVPAKVATGEATELATGDADLVGATGDALSVPGAEVVAAASGDAIGDAASVTAAGDPVGSGDPIDGDAAGLVAGDSVGSGVEVDGVSGDGEAEEIVPATVGDVTKSTGVPTGDASVSGLGGSVTARSMASWVRTPGATVTTGSLGGADDWVSNRARRMLASSAPAAMTTFVRFKLDPMLRA